MATGIDIAFSAVANSGRSGAVCKILELPVTSLKVALGAVDGTLYSVLSYLDEDYHMSGMNFIEFLQFAIEGNHLMSTQAVGRLATNTIIGNVLTSEEVIDDVGVVKFNDGKYYPEVVLNMSNKKFTLLSNAESLAVEKNVCWEQSWMNIECEFKTEYHLDYYQCSVDF